MNLFCATGEREAEYLADAKLSTKGETLSIIEGTTLELLQAVANGQDPTLHLVSYYS